MDIKFIQLMLAFAGMVALTGCTGSKGMEDRNYMLEWNGEPLKTIEQMPRYEDLPSYKAAAYAGSGKAANSLSAFYMKLDSSGVQSQYWNQIAAENGDPVGQANLAEGYLDPTQSTYSPHRAIFWLRRSADQGYPNAIKRLKEIEGRRTAPQ